MGILKYLLVGLLSFTCHFHVCICCGYELLYGNMTSDYDLEVGSTLNVQCNLFSNNITYNGENYYVTSENLRLKFKEEFIENITIVNDLTVEYTVENADVQNSGGYSCYLSIPGLQTNRFVCATNVSVGYKPLPVKNFSCISYDYQNLTCTWEKPFNPVRTDYKLWDILLKVFTRECPVRLNSTSCLWRLDTKPPYVKRHDTLNFMLVGNNSLGEQRQYISVDHFKIVKPGPPQNVRITNISATSLVIHWSPSKGMEYGGFEPGLLYSIKYRPVAAYKDKFKESTFLSQFGGSLEITDLIPHTEYEFEIRCRSNLADDDRMWSSSVTAFERTEPDVPYLAPEITPSSFEVESILGNRSITLYWKGIPAEFENGENFHYIIHYHVHHIPSRVLRHSKETDAGNNTVFTFQHMDTRSAYLFKIFAANDNGSSSNSSQIIVDKADNLITGPKEIIAIHYGQGNFNISWKSADPSVKNFTLFWCKSSNPRPNKCESALQWMHPSKLHQELHLPIKNTYYQFAVSSEFNGQTSGMVWASCIVQYSGVRYKVKRMELTPKNSTSLKVQWSLDCDAQKVVMIEYAIHYCAAGNTCSQNHDIRSCSDWKIKHVSNVSQDEYILGDLKPFTCYLAFMRAHSFSGWSEKSNVASESTMSSAPSDPPRNVKVIGINETSIFISFNPPLTPNGIVTRYVVYYNKTSDNTSHYKEVRTQEMDHTHANILDEVVAFHVQLRNYVTYYTNYSIEVKACVDQACSLASKPVFARTGISKPGILHTPRVEVIDGAVNISWDPPNLPNGPVNMYQILKESNDTTKDKMYNITSHTYLALKEDCAKEAEDKTVYSFRIRAVNFKDDNPMYGDFSKPVKTMLCPGDPSYGLVIGITVGCAAGFIILILVVYSLASWMKSEVDMIKGINVQLPKGLDASLENPLSSYDKFKNGLQKSHDSGIPYDRTYERLRSFASESDIKELGNGINVERTQKLKRSNSARNNSGESNTSGKCHDSISSSNTTKTHLSIDSGAEVDTPPSPDETCSTTNSTPRSNKNELDIIKEGNSSNSKDSGLEKELTCSAFGSKSLDLPSKFSWYVKKKNYPFSTIQVPKCNGQMPAYCKFAVLANSNVPSSYVMWNEQSHSLLENHSLSNSEPSVADFDIDSGDVPLVIPGIQPYSKFGLARSASNVTSQPLAAMSNVGYSKFGIVYRPLKSDKHDDAIACSTYPEGASCNPEALSHLVFNNSSVLKSFQPPTVTNQCWNVHSIEGQEISPKPDLCSRDCHNAYSKYGVNAPPSELKKKGYSNGYVSFMDTVKQQSSENSPSIHQATQPGYSKLGVGCLEDSLEHSQENGVIISAAHLPNSSSYVPFQKIVSSNDVPKRDHEHFNAKTEQPGNDTKVPENRNEGSSCGENEDKGKHCSDPADDSSSFLQEMSSDLSALMQSQPLEDNHGIPETSVSCESDNPMTSKILNGVGVLSEGDCKNESIEDKNVDSVVNCENNNDISCNYNAKKQKCPDDFRSDLASSESKNKPIPSSTEKQSVNMPSTAVRQLNNEGCHVPKPSKGYVPLSELTKESDVTLISRPNLSCCHVESV